MIADLRNEFEEHFDYMSLIGSKMFMCPFVGRSKLSINCHRFVCFLVIFTAVQLFLAPCIYGVTDWMEIINVAPNIGACLMSLIKYCKMHGNKEVYAEILKHFRNDLWEFFPHHLPKSMNILVKYKNVLKYIAKFFLCVSVALIIVVDSLPYVIMTYENKLLGKELKYLYPFDAWYPFDKVKWYSVAYVWESVMTAVVICIYALSNLFHVSYVALICMELDLLGKFIEELISSQDIDYIIQRKMLEETHGNIKKHLKCIAKNHAYLARKTMELDNILGDIMLLIYTSGAVLICLTAFSFTIVDDLFTSLRYFSFFVSLLIECFSQCIIGQALVDHSTKLGKMIYFSNWTYADAETRKILLLLMARTQKPFTLTANRYVIMNLNTFSRICSSSYNCFNLLRTIYKR